MSFQATQNAFMQHIRDPENNVFPDIEDRRLYPFNLKMQV